MRSVNNVQIDDSLVFNLMELRMRSGNVRKVERRERMIDVREFEKEDQK